MSWTDEFCQAAFEAGTRLFFQWPMGCKYKLRKKKINEEEEPTVLELSIVTIIALNSQILRELVQKFPELYWFLSLNIQHVRKQRGGVEQLKLNSRSVHVLKNLYEEKGNKLLQEIAFQVVSIEFTLKTKYLH
jgi:hypothetical protein